MIHNKMMSLRGRDSNFALQSKPDFIVFPSQYAAYSNIPFIISPTVGPTFERKPKADAQGQPQRRRLSRRYSHEPASELSWFGYAAIRTTRFEA